MKRIIVFPGQGSQFVGMGEELFSLYPREVRLASEVLGYSIKELCLSDPNGSLNKTEYTQPALFFVNVLHYLKQQEFDSVNALASKVPADDLLFAGHSLGEYCALFAAGAFDFATGLQLVQKRGALMAEVAKGSMAAVMDIDQGDVSRILLENNLETIDIANINSRKQTIISGIYKDIAKAAEIFEKHSARYIPLNVSAAFHSRYMSGVAEEFAKYLQGFRFNALNAVVVSNLTAKPYPKENYQELLVKQINHSVLWYESISKVLASGVDDVVETGPGMVLSRMCSTIKADPLEVEKTSFAFGDGNQQPEKSSVYVMFAGQGTQYYGMGAELYRENPIFKNSMDECDQIVKSFIGYSIVDEIYQLDMNQDFDFIRASHPAIVSVGYSLYKVIESSAATIDGFIGHSLGEYISAVASGVISLKDCLEMVCIQAQLLETHAQEGGLLSVLANTDFISKNVDLFKNVHLAARNSDKSIMFSGSKSDLLRLRTTLEKLAVISVLLPVDYAFHSSAVDCIRDKFLDACKHIDIAQPNLELLSASSPVHSERITLNYFWRAIREPIEFRELIGSKKLKNVTLVDASATGSLSGFLRQIPEASNRHMQTINQFGNNLSTLNSAIEMIA